MVFVGRIPDGLVVRHLCNNPSCVEPKHLMVGTQADNIRDAMIARRHVHGGTHGCAKLTEQDVCNIRLSREEGISEKDLATIYKVDRKTINNIVRYQNWKHVA